MMMMMKADPESAPREVSRKETRPVAQDETILSSFDPVVEGASFQIFEEGLDPREFARIYDASDEFSAPEVLATFDLGETLARVPAKLFFRIGEVAELLEVKTYVLRFWETEFPMVSPSKSRSGQRVYRKKDVEMLLLIKHLLYVERFSIEGARKRIRELKQKPSERAALSVKKIPMAADPSVASVVPAAQMTAGDRESLRMALAELEKFAKPEVSKFFRF
jgi:DNA-binding transcriptional MerR regulator